MADASIPASPTRYLVFWGGTGGGVINQFPLIFDHSGSAFVGLGDIRSRWPTPLGGQLSLLTVYRGVAQPVGTSATYEIYIQGVATGMTLTINAGELRAQNAVDVRNVAANEYVEIRQTAVVGAPGAANLQFQLLFIPA